MKTMARLLKAERTREQMALLKIGSGLTLKECAWKLGLKTKMAEYHWAQVQKQIRAAKL